MLSSAPDTEESRAVLDLLCLMEAADAERLRLLELAAGLQNSKREELDAMPAGDPARSTEVQKMVSAMEELHVVCSRKEAELVAAVQSRSAASSYAEERAMDSMHRVWDRWTASRGAGDDSGSGEYMCSYACCLRRRQFVLKRDAGEDGGAGRGEAESDISRLGGVDGIADGHGRVVLVPGWLHLCKNELLFEESAPKEQYPLTDGRPSAEATTSVAGSASLEASKDGTVQMMRIKIGDLKSVEEVDFLETELACSVQLKRRAGHLADWVLDLLADRDQLCASISKLVEDDAKGCTEDADGEIVLLSGSFFKRGQIRKNWKRRYMVLTPTRLSYFKDRTAFEDHRGDTTAALGTILLAGVRRLEHSAAPRSTKRMSAGASAIRSLRRLHSSSGAKFLTRNSAETLGEEKDKDEEKRNDASPAQAVVERSIADESVATVAVETTTISLHTEDRLFLFEVPGYVKDDVPSPRQSPGGQPGSGPPPTRTMAELWYGQLYDAIEAAKTAHLHHAFFAVLKMNSRGRLQPRIIHFDLESCIVYNTKAGHTRRQFTFADVLRHSGSADTSAAALPSVSLHVRTRAFPYRLFFTSEKDRHAFRSLLSKAAGTTSPAQLNLTDEQRKFHATVVGGYAGESIGNNRWRRVWWQQYGGGHLACFLLNAAQWSAKSSRSACVHPVWMLQRSLVSVRARGQLEALVRVKDETGLVLHRLLFTTEHARYMFIRAANGKNAGESPHRPMSQIAFAKKLVTPRGESSSIHVGPAVEDQDANADASDNASMSAAESSLDVEAGLDDGDDEDMPVEVDEQVYHADGAERSYWLSTHTDADTDLREEDDLLPYELCYARRLSGAPHEMYQNGRLGLLEDDPANPSSSSAGSGSHAAENVQQRPSNTGDSTDSTASPAVAINSRPPSRVVPGGGERQSSQTHRQKGGRHYDSLKSAKAMHRIKHNGPRLRWVTFGSSSTGDAQLDNLAIVNPKKPKDAIHIDIGSILHFRPGYNAVKSNRSRGGSVGVDPSRCLTIEFGQPGTAAVNPGASGKHPSAITLQLGTQLELFSYLAAVRAVTSITVLQMESQWDASESMTEAERLYNAGSYEQCVEYFEVAASQGVAAAAAYLGLLHAQGLHFLKADEEVAGRWFKQAVDHGLLVDDRPWSRFTLAMMYYYGYWLMGESDEDAIRLLTLAAEDGHCGARFELGHKMLHGMGGIERNAEAGQQLLRVAESQGHARAGALLRRGNPSES